MNVKNLIISSLIGGIVIAAVANIPVLNFVNCLLCIGYWAGAILAVWLYRRFEGTLTLGQGVAVGAVAGVWSGLINFVIGLLSAAGIATIISAIDQVIPAETLDLDGDFIGRMAVLINVFLVIFNVFLGTIGGLIGGAIFQTKPQESDDGELILEEMEEPPAELIDDQGKPETEDQELPPAEES
jgi:hypothetical protein